MKRHVLVTAVFGLAAALVLSAPAFAQSLKQRMLDRLPAIVELKNKGIVGENNQGYLEFRGAKKEGEDVVRAENADRKAVYGAIAKKQGTTPQLVGQRRAQQIAREAEPGQWLQKPDGSWYRK